MAKKIFCVALGIFLSVLELAFFKVPVLTALAGCILPVGYTSLAFVVLTDYLEDKKVTPLMIATYACAFVTVALLGIALQTNAMWFFVTACAFIVAGAVCYFINRKKINAAISVQE